MQVLACASPFFSGVTYLSINKEKMKEMIVYVYCFPRSAVSDHLQRPIHGDAG
jgi:hypothetical protein